MEDCMERKRRSPLRGPLVTLALSPDDRVLRFGWAITDTQIVSYRSAPQCSIHSRPGA